jgi:hypothetical protein
MADAFSDDSTNGFLLLGRYERGMQGMVMRLLRQFEQLKKHHPTTPHADDELPVPRERAWPYPIPRNEPNRSQR